MLHASPLRSLAARLLMAACALGMAACSGYDDGPEEASPSVTNIVTFMGNDAANHATFHFYPPGEALPIELTADRPLDAEASDLRCLATYIPANGPLSSGEVSLVSCSLVNDIAVEVAPLESFGSWWDATPIYVRSIWAGGPYINLDCLLPYYTSPRALRLFILEVADPDSGEPLTDLAEYDAYLAHKADSSPTFDRQYYISYDLREFLLSHPDAVSLRVHINNSADSSVGTFTITIPRSDG